MCTADLTHQKFRSIAQCVNCSTRVSLGSTIQAKAKSLKQHRLKPKYIRTDPYGFLTSCKILTGPDMNFQQTRHPNLLVVQKKYHMKYDEKV